MKTKSVFLFFIGILSFCNSTKSQSGTSTNYDFAPVGAKWTYTHLYYMSNTIDTMIVRSINDTTIDGHVCHIIKKNFNLCDTRPTREYVYSENEKVYFYDQSRNKFQTLYDFSAVVNDSIVVYPGQLPNNDSIVTIVDSIKTININGVDLKKFFVHYFSSSSEWQTLGDGEILENVGDLYYLFPWTNGVCDASWAGPLRCYEDLNIGFLEFGTAPNCNYVFDNINENYLEKWSLYPNPCNDELNLETRISITGTLEVSIYNEQGQAVMQQTIQSPAETINTSALKPGIYLLKMINSQYSESHRLVKLN